MFVSSEKRWGGIEEKLKCTQKQEMHMNHRRRRQGLLGRLGKLFLVSERRRKIHILRKMHTDKYVNASFLLFQVATAGASSTRTRGDPSYS